jgi:photosystem II stability/assembly factor-like uncharacterized protein
MPIVKRTLPFLILLLLAAPTLAASGRWSLLGPDGGTVTTLAVDPVDSRIVYAATQEGEGVFKSRDGGETWSPSGTGLPKIPGNNVFCLAIDPRRPAILYVGTLNFGIYKSTDGGASWSPSQRGLSANLLGVSALAIDPLAPNTVFAGTGVGIFKTTDGGANWKLKNGGLPDAPLVTDLAIDPKRPAVVYAAVGTSGLYKSTNGGETWTPSNRGLPAQQGVATLTIDPRRSATVYAATYAGLFKSTNGGASWFPSNTGLPKSVVSALAIDPRNSRTLFAGTFFGTGVFRSDDGGASWSPINAGLSNLVVWALAIAPQGTVYAATEGDSKPGGVFQSADGQTWRRTVRGLSTLEITALAAEAAGPGAPSILWAGTPSLGVFRSPNGGGVWRRVPIPGAIGPVNAIVVDPAHAGTAYVLANYLDGSGGLTIRLFKTHDAGRTWSRLPFPATAGPFFNLIRDPRTGTLWLAGYGLARSTDGGLTWTAPSGIVSSDFLLDVGFDPSSPQVLYAAGYLPRPSRLSPTETRLYKSTDGGASWTRTDAGLVGTGGVQKVLVSPANSQVVYAASFSVLFRSTDAGAHWDRVADAPQQGSITDLAAGPDGTLYAATGNTGIYSSPDGLVWTSISNGLSSLAVNGLEFDPADPDTLYAGTASAGIEACTFPR